MATKTYAKTDKTQLTPNFNITEFHCKGTTCGCTETLHDPALSSYLQQIRDHFGKPVHITSGYRCEKHNAATANAASRSRHTMGQAADFTISGVKPAEIAKFAESIGVLGIGLYDNFVHIDTREKKSFWYGHGQEYRETFGGAAAKCKIYIVTCRLNGSPTLHTLIFDRAAGAGVQRIGNSSAAIEMKLTAEDAKFTPITIGKDTATIMTVSRLER